MKHSITIIGAGNWGTTLAVILAQKGIKVRLHSVFNDHNLAMQKARTNALFLKGVKFPDSLTVEPILDNALSAEHVVIAIPVKYMRSILKRIKKCRISLDKKFFISVSKGIEAKTLERVSQIMTTELKTSRIAVLSGPNIAREVMKGVPSASVLVCKQKKTGQYLQGLFSTATFRVYLRSDLVGVELAGALKNVIALACGIADGLQLGTNTKAALVTRGLTEITRLGKALGAKPETFWGISGLGDLVTTCFSPHSRNRSVGEAIGRGEKIKTIIERMKMVAEGVETVKSAYALSKRYKVEMPITCQVYAVLYRNKSAHAAVRDLMKRPLKAEKVY